MKYLLLTFALIIVGCSTNTYKKSEYVRRGSQAYKTKEAEFKLSLEKATFLLYKKYPSKKGYHGGDIIGNSYVFYVHPHSKMAPVREYYYVDGNSGKVEHKLK